MDLLELGCPVCGTENRAEPVLPYAREAWRLKACKTCGMVYLENPPRPEALEEELAWEKTFAQESATRQRRHPRLHALGRAPKAWLQRLTRRDKLVDLVTRYVAPGPVLDVGCAGGHTLARLPARYVPSGIEISRELSHAARTLFAPRGGTVMQGEALAALATFPEAAFSGVIMTSFLEHDFAAADTLRATRRVLRPQGKLIVKVPNYASWNRRLRGAAWCGFRFPDHVNYFTPVTLRELLRRTGFRVVRFGVLDRLPTSDTMWLVAGVA